MMGIRLPDSWQYTALLSGSSELTSHTVWWSGHCTVGGGSGAQSHSYNFLLSGHLLLPGSHILQHTVVSSGPEPGTPKVEDMAYFPSPSWWSVTDMQRIQVSFVVLFTYYLTGTTSADHLQNEELSAFDGDGFIRDDSDRTLKMKREVMASRYSHNQLSFYFRNLGNPKRTASHFVVNCLKH